MADMLKEIAENTSLVHLSIGQNFGGKGKYVLCFAVHVVKMCVCIMCAFLRACRYVGLGDYLLAWMSSYYTRVCTTIMCIAMLMFSTVTVLMVSVSSVCCCALRSVSYSHSVLLILDSRSTLELSCNLYVSTHLSKT